MATIVLKCESDSPAFDQRPHQIEVEEVTERGWKGRPVDNPMCPTLFFPRYAWKQVA